MDSETIAIIQQLSNLVQSLGVVGLSLTILALFIQGKLHSDKGVERQLAPYKDRLTMVDNGFDQRLENMEQAAVENEKNTKRIADFLEAMVTNQAESRERMTAAVTKLTTTLDLINLQTASGRRRK